VHEEGFQLAWRSGGAVEFRTPHGRLLSEAPPPPRCATDPFEALVKRLEDGAIVVEPYTGTPTWDGTRPDLALAIEGLLAKTNPEQVGVRSRSCVEPEVTELMVDQSPVPTATVLNDEHVEDDEEDEYEPSLARLTQFAVALDELRAELSLNERYLARSADPSLVHDAVWNPNVAIHWGED
jgi:hypothetical protein